MRQTLRKQAIGFSLLIVTLLSSCQAEGFTDPWTGKAEEEGKNFQAQITCTFYPLYDFANKILGNVFEEGEFQTPYIGNTLNFVGEQEVHDFDPSDPQKMVQAYDSLCVFSLMPVFDSWSEDLGDSDTPVYQIGYLAEIEDLNGNIIDENSGYGLDPHVWLSPRRAIKMVEAMTDCLVGAFEQSGIDETSSGDRIKDVLENNSNQYVSELKELDADYARVLAPFKGRTMVTSHECFSYLCQDYGLKQYGISDFADNEPDPLSLAEMEDYLYENKISTIFVESLDSSAAVDTVTEDLAIKGQKIETKVLYSLESLPNDEILAGEDYISVMRKNLEILSDSL